MDSWELFIKSWIVFFVIIGPLDIMVIFGTLVKSKTFQEQKKIAIKSNLIAFFILLFFMFFGMKILSSVGISLDALRIGGGLLLLLIAYRILFDDNTSHSLEYGEERSSNVIESKDDVSVFPLATPLLAGAGSMSATVLYTAHSSGYIAYAVVATSFGTVLLLNGILCLLYIKFQKYLGATLINIITRITGILLTALSVQFIIDGLKGVGAI